MAPFKEVAAHSECTILTHEVNKGKGRGLKTAFEFCLENRKDIDGVVTVDGDNQHRAKDIKKCSETMVSTGNVVLGVSPTEDDVMQTLNMAGVAVDRKRLDGIYSGTEDREEYLQYLKSIRENYVENDPDEIKMSYLDKAITYVGQIRKPKTSKDENKGIDGEEDAAEIQEDEEPIYSSADVITLMPNYFAEKNRDGVRFAIKNTKLNIDNPIIVGK